MESTARHGQRLSANEAPPPMMMSVRSPQDSDLHGFLEIQNFFPPMFWFHLPCLYVVVMFVSYSECVGWVAILELRALCYGPGVVY